MDTPTLKELGISDREYEKILEFFTAGLKEMAWAKRAWPGDEIRTMVFVEEAGEVLKEAINFRNRKTDRLAVCREAVHSLATLLRLILEGDSTMDMLPPWHLGDSDFVKRKL